VQYAAISDALPPDIESEDDTFNIAGRPWSDQEFPSTTLPKVSPDYFRALGAPLLRGRFFTPQDTATSAPVTIISESLARRYFPGVDPIGQKLQPSSPNNNSPFTEIVGVVGDLKYWGLESKVDTAYYLPYTQNLSTSSFLLVRSPQPAAALAPMIQRTIQSLDKDAVVRRVLTMDDLISESVAEPRFRTLLLSSFGALALVLAAVGIYGVIAYSVTQRTQEIGVRMALGATRRDVLTLVLRQSLMPVGIGIALGTTAALLATRLVATLLYQVTATDPVTFVAVVACLAVTGLVATGVPAWRAMNADPLTALRSE
jgi:putative ABC transport system permease protein